MLLLGAFPFSRWAAYAGQLLSKNTHPSCTSIQPSTFLSSSLFAAITGHFGTFFGDAVVNFSTKDDQADYVSCSHCCCVFLKSNDVVFVRLQLLRKWESRERKKARDYEKEKDREKERKTDESKEARRLKEFFEDYDDERDDVKFYKCVSVHYV